MTYTPLSSSQHSNLHLTRGTFFVFENQPCVPISTVEAPRAALDLPIAFARTQKGLSLVAILSLDKEDNAHVGPKGLWMGGYMPVVVRAHPFALVFKEDKARVIVDSESDWLSQTEGQPLFESDGSRSQVLERLVNLLRNQAPNPNRDTPALQAIEASGVLKPWSETFEGLQHVDPQALAGLGAEDFLKLRESNALPVIYAQLMSMPRLNRIKNLAQRKHKMAEKMGLQVSEEDILLSFEDDDILRFSDE